MPESNIPLETQPQKDSLGEVILGFCHKQYDGAVEFAFGKQVYVPFTDKKVSRPELWLGLPTASAFITSAITEIPIIMLGVASRGEILSQNPEVAIGLGLMAAAGGVGIGLAAATGIEVMSGIRKASAWTAENITIGGIKSMSEKVATKLRNTIGKGREVNRAFGETLLRGTKAIIRPRK